MPSSLARLALVALVALVALLGLAACEQPPAPDAAPAGSAAPSAAPSAQTAAEPPPPPPDDLDVAELQAALKCAASAKSGPCAILAKAASCSPWGASVPSGEGRWIGRASVVAEGKVTDTFAILRLKNVPLAEIGPGQLPAKVALAEIPKDESSAHGQADRVIRAFERGDVPPRTNPALEYLKQRTEWPDAPAVRTRGGHVQAIAQGGLYLCEGPKRQLLAVQRAATRRGSGDGTYAELWATTW